MDISVRTVDYGVEDRSWLGSAHGTEATRTITLDMSTFTAGTHYPDGFIPSGTVVARNDTSGMYEPYDGDNTAAGFLFNSITVASDANVGARCSNTASSSKRSSRTTPGSTLPPPRPWPAGSWSGRKELTDEHSA